MLEEELRRTLRAVAMQREDAERQAAAAAAMDNRAEELSAPAATHGDATRSEEFPDLGAESAAFVPPNSTDDRLRGGVEALMGPQRRLTFKGSLLSPVDPAAQGAERAKELADQRDQQQQLRGLPSLPKIPHVEAVAGRERFPLPMVVDGKPERPPTPPLRRDLMQQPPGVLVAPLASSPPKRTGSRPAVDAAQAFGHHIGLGVAPQPRGLLASAAPEPVAAQKREDHAYNSRVHVAPHLREVARLPTPQPQPRNPRAATSGTVDAVVAPPPGMLVGPDGGDDGDGWGADEGLAHLRRSAYVLGWLMVSAILCGMCTFVGAVARALVWGCVFSLANSSTGGSYVLRRTLRQLIGSTLAVCVWLLHHQPRQHHASARPGSDIGGTCRCRRWVDTRFAAAPKHHQRCRDRCHATASAAKYRRLPIRRSRWRARRGGMAKVAAKHASCGAKADTATGHHRW